MPYNPPRLSIPKEASVPAQARRSAVPLFVLLLSLSLAAASFAADPSQNVDFQWGVRIPMRDGVELAASVYRPAGQKEPLPVIFTLTPYIGDSYQDRAMYFARHGYVYALVDVRGRGDSGGVFDPFAQEARDGYDAVEWLARQPWSNGKVAMWGGSYAGFDQWTVAKERPPHLVTIVPAAAVHPGVDFPALNGIFYSYNVQWLSFTSGHAKNTLLFGEETLWQQKDREMYLGHLPYRQLDRIVGNPSSAFQTWLSHPTYDDYWKAMVPSPEQYARIDIPILTITGHFDGDQPGALTYYRNHQRYAPKEVADRHYLIIGPWDHAGTRTPAAKMGGLTFAAASVLDLNALHKEWYDWTMKDGPRPKFLEKKVSYYVTGPDEQWKRADSLESIGAERRTLYLGSDGGRAGDAFHSGYLADATPKGAAQPDRFVYDPLDTRPGTAEDENTSEKSYLLTQATALNLFGAGVVYHSEPFAEATEVSGQVQLALWMALDVPDTDFLAELYEIQPDGDSLLLTRAYLRARYRDSTEKESLVPLNRPVRYDFNGFSWFSRRVAKGSRLRLVVYCPNSSGLEKNYNSGGVVADETAKDARTAHVTLYHDAEHPSVLEIPIVR